MIITIISGGQTGVDLIALIVAKRLGYKTGGYAPKGWLTESGPQKELLESYGLVEANKAGYEYRTEQNIILGTMTLIYDPRVPIDQSKPQLYLSGGTALTYSLCMTHKRRVLINPAPFLVDAYIHTYPVVNTAINIAGPRGSKLTIEEQDHVEKQITIMLESI